MSVEQLEQAILDAVRDDTDNLDALLQEAMETMTEAQFNRVADVAIQMMRESLDELRGWKEVQS